MANYLETFSVSQEVAEGLRGESDHVRDKLIDRRSDMFMNGREERALRTEALMGETEAAQRAGIAKEALEILAKLA